MVIVLAENKSWELRPMAENDGEIRINKNLWVLSGQGTTNSGDTIVEITSEGLDDLLDLLLAVKKARLSGK